MLCICQLVSDNTNPERPVTQVQWIAGLAVEFFDIDAIFNSVDCWCAGHTLESHALVHGQGYLHEFARVQCKHRCAVALGAEKTLLRQCTTNATSARTWGYDKHSHDWPLRPKELCLGCAWANICDGANYRAFYFSNNDFSSIGKRGHIPDLCLKRWPIVVRIFEPVSYTHLDVYKRQVEPDVELKGVLSVRTI